MSNPTSLSEIGDKFARGVDLFLFRSSFETRSLSIAQMMVERVGRTVMFHSKVASSLASMNTASIESLAKAEKRYLDTKDPLTTADAMLQVAKEIFDEPNGVSLLDVSAFRREELLILVGMLARCAKQQPAPDCTLAYVGASRMADDWLSRNTVACRSVMGFAGEMRLSRPTHMVVMLGFEVERAVSLIESYEPSRITIGLGGQTESISQSLHARNRSFFDRIRSLYGETERFEFSLRNPIKTMHDIESVLDKDTESNFTLAPLNNKLSTIGAGMLAVQRPNVQVCYAAVAEYNEVNYSAPSNDVYLFPLRELLGELKLTVLHESVF